MALADLEGLGPRRLHELVGRYGSFREVLAAGRRRDEGFRDAVGPKLAARAAALRPVPRGRPAALRDAGVRIRARGLPGYPDRLLHLHDPPPVLYLRGRRELLDLPSVAVVGTRRATEYGRRSARDLAMGLAEAGLCVVSGMARGIDARAHEAALDAAGATVGVLGSGLDHRYPAANRRLYDRMEGAGLLVSEFPPEQPPLSGLFPRRNRIIAALSRAVVVVQAGRRSGALNTVGHALDLGREVLAVPGPVGVPASDGVHGLLRDGAALAERAADVLELLGLGDGAAADTSAPDGGAVGQEGGWGRHWWKARASLTAGPRTVDELSAATGLGVPDLLALLTRWELEGTIESTPGGRYGLAVRLGRQGRR